jgi:phage-related protein
VSTKFFETLSVHFGKVASALKEWASKFSELISKLTPVVSEALGNVSKSFASVTTTFLEIFSRVVSRVLEALKANSGDIQKIFSIFADFVRETSVNLREVANEIRKLVEELAKTLIKQLESQPAFDTFKVKYGEFYKMFLERFEGVFAEIAETLKEVLPNAELKDLAETFSAYVQKKVRGETVDDVKELKTIIEKLVKAFTTLVNLPEVTGVPGLQGLNVDNILKFSVVSL